MTDKYVLDADGNPQPEPDFMKWHQWHQTADRHVAWTEIGEALVSTVFLGFDHSFGDEPPILFETMIFWQGHDLDREQDHYATRDEALAGHEAMVACVRAALTLREP
jgi:hypothetical protein